MDKARKTAGRSRHPLELNQMVSRNRLRLGVVAAVFTLLNMALSGAGIFFIYRPLGFSLDFWLALILFWAAFLLYAILRFYTGWRWIYGEVKSCPPETRDLGLRDALDAACLAAGLEGEVRLRVIPHADINSYSIALPDGSYVVFATRGVEEKLPPRSREAMMAHEMGHIQAGDALLHTVLLSLMGRSSLSARRMESGAWLINRERRGELQQRDLRLISVVTVVALGLPAMASFRSQTSLWAVPVVVACVFLLMAMMLSALAHILIRLAMDREREYHADLLAAYRTRDPLAIYRAVEGAAYDVADVLLLPPYLDALLFHPVVDYTSYRPFQTQPTMQERLRRLRQEFPSLEVELAETDP
jgi:Zn-dependent protease with chaperone function